MSTLRIIKKYPNRRLYDSEIGAYITLDDIKTLVIQRINFKVIDAKSEKDLTQHTLLQIIAEQETSTTPLFSTDMLQDFIRFYNDNSQMAFRQNLEQMMQLFADQRDVLTDQWQSYWDLWLGKHKNKKG